MGASFIAFLGQTVEAADWQLTFFGGQDGLLTSLALKATTSISKGHDKPTITSDEFTFGVAVNGSLERPLNLPFDIGSRVGVGISQAKIEWPKGIGVISNPMTSELDLYFIDTRIFATKSLFKERLEIDLGAGLWLFDAEQRSKLATFNLVDRASGKLPYVFARGAYSLGSYSALVGEVSHSRIGPFSSVYLEVRI